MINTLGWRSLEQRRADARLTMFHKIVYIWSSNSSWDFFAAIHTFRDRSEWPGICTQITLYRSIHQQTTINTRSFIWQLCSGTASFLGCPFWWPVQVQVYHLQPISHYAISRESLFLSAYKLIFLPQTNTTFLATTILILTFFYQLHLILARGCCRIYRKKENI